MTGVVKKSRDNADADGQGELEDVQGELEDVQGFSWRAV